MSQLAAAVATAVVIVACSSDQTGPGETTPLDQPISVYEVHNNGWPYNLGFVIGAACLHGGGGAASRRRRGR